MRTRTTLLAVSLAVVLGACSHQRSGEDSRDPAARKAGRAAYQVTRETEKLAKKAGEKLKEATHEAHEGWKEASQDAKAKNRK